jgi:hypothetical protein
MADAANAFDRVLAVSSDPEMRRQAAGYLSLVQGEKRR